MGYEDIAEKVKDSKTRQDMVKILQDEYKKLEPKKEKKEGEGGEEKKE